MQLTAYRRKHADVQALAALLAEIIHDDEAKAKGHWRDQVTAFRGRFNEMGYCF